MTKSIVSSKTIWAAGIAEVIVLLQTYGDTAVVDQHVLLIALPILFAVLRLITNTPVSLTGK